MFMMGQAHFGRRSLLRKGMLLAAGSALNQSGAEDAIDQSSITDVGGVRVGHFTDSRRPTGCTVVIFDRAAVAGVDVRGSAPGTRETDLLNPINTVQAVNAFLLTGGSAFGLDAASGVMRYLDEHGLGYKVGTNVVPIVPAAVLFDLEIGDGKIRPDSRAGYAACQSAVSSRVMEGNVGAGAGATVGKLFGRNRAMKSGLGTASIKIGDTGLIIGGLVAVNAAGDVLDRKTGTILAGARSSDGRFLNTIQQLIQGATVGTGVPSRSGESTTIGVLVTNATLNKSEATKVAQMAHDGLARVINPVHTPFDGDTIFAAATGSNSTRADLAALGAIGAEVMALAINRAVLAATGIPGYPAHRDLARSQQ